MCRPKWFGTHLQPYICYIQTFYLPMYIDSPDFPKRKVVADRSHPAGTLGLERLRLANFVADELNNNHKNDAAILEKFRREAVQYKQNLLRGKANRPIISSQPTLESEPLALPSPYSSSATLPKNNQEPISIRPPPSPSVPQRILVKEVVRMGDGYSNGYQQLVMMLDRKDRQLAKQAKILNKNQYKIETLRKRVNRMEYQSKMREAERLAALEHNSYQKIKSYISSMANRLNENEQLLSQNFSDMIPPTSQLPTQSQRQCLRTLKSKTRSQSMGIKPHLQTSPYGQEQEYDSPSALNPELMFSPSPKVQENGNSHNHNLKINSNRRGSTQNSVVYSLGGVRNRLDNVGTFF